jgi:hypothetical protein
MSRFLVSIASLRASHSGVYQVRLISRPELIAAATAARLLRPNKMAAVAGFLDETAAPLERTPKR